MRVLKSRMLKRAVDVTVAGAALVAAAPILAAATVAVRATMGAPVFFRQDRPGVHGKPFRLVKFRTMRPSAAADTDPTTDAQRLTRLGSLLRSTSIDELPTLWNVLKGDMSLVGPRPLLMRYLPRYSPHQARRHEVPPGLTGLAQVRGRNTLSWTEKFDLDVWYVDHWSLTLDARILVETIVSVFKRQGISAQGHATMPEFFGSEPGVNAATKRQ